jgi:serine/threonine protein phosphatase PrpC
VHNLLVAGTSMCKEEKKMVPPEVITVERDPEDEYLILPSDGLWEFMTPASACAFVRLRLFATVSETTDGKGSPTLLAKELAEDAINKGSQDNVGVVIILFRDFWN